MFPLSAFVLAIIAVTVLCKEEGLVTEDSQSHFSVRSREKLIPAKAVLITNSSGWLQSNNKLPVNGRKTSREIIGHGKRFTSNLRGPNRKLSPSPWKVTINLFVPCQGKIPLTPKDNLQNMSLKLKQIVISGGPNKPQERKGSEKYQSERKVKDTYRGKEREKRKMEKNKSAGKVLDQEKKVLRPGKLEGGINGALKNRRERVTEIETDKGEIRLGGKRLGIGKIVSTKKSTKVIMQNNLRKVSSKKIIIDTNSEYPKGDLRDVKYKSSQGKHKLQPSFIGPVSSTMNINCTKGSNRTHPLFLRYNPFFPFNFVRKYQVPLRSRGQSIPIKKTFCNRMCRIISPTRQPIKNIKGTVIGDQVFRILNKQKNNSSHNQNRKDIEKYSSVGETNVCLEKIQKDVGSEMNLKVEHVNDILDNCNNSNVTMFIPFKHIGKAADLANSSLVTSDRTNDEVYYILNRTGAIVPGKIFRKVCDSDCKNQVIGSLLGNDQDQSLEKNGNNKSGTEQLKKKYTYFQNQFIPDTGPLVINQFQQEKHGFYPWNQNSFIKNIHKVPSHTSLTNAYLENQFAHDTGALVLNQFQQKKHGFYPWNQNFFIKNKYKVPSHTSLTNAYLENQFTPDTGALALNKFQQGHYIQMLGEKYNPGPVKIRLNSYTPSDDWVEETVKVEDSRPHMKYGITRIKTVRDVFNKRNRDKVYCTPDGNRTAFGNGLILKGYLLNKRSPCYYVPKFDTESGNEIVLDGKTICRSIYDYPQLLTPIKADETEGNPYENVKATLLTYEPFIEEPLLDLNQFTIKYYLLPENFLV